MIDKFASRETAVLSRTLKQIHELGKLLLAREHPCDQNEVLRASEVIHGKPK